MKQCRVCGALSYDDTAFCYICGTKFPDCEELDLSDKSKNIENARYEVDCPARNSVLVINEETLRSGSMICPNCSVKAEFDIENNEMINSVRGDESESLLFDGLYQYKYGGDANTGTHGKRRLPREP